MQDSCSDEKRLCMQKSHEKLKTKNHDDDACIRKCDTSWLLF